MRWALIACLALLAGCESNLINNPSFDRWCGDHLCDWTLDSGAIQRVGSWHEKDYAVSFLDQDTRISQVTRQASFETCLRFESIADVDALSQLTLVVDFNDDGPDFELVIPETHWNSIATSFTAPATYDKVRYAIEKRGQGRAVLAQLWLVGCQEATTQENQ